MRTFTYSDVKSHKFWNIELQGNSFTVTYGRQGTAGQTQTKTFPSAAAAQKEHDKLIKEKLAKGYVEKPSAKPKTSLREALEDALIANPDDLAAHMAYADYLQEQGDPRGEFIQVQLALEDESKSTAERKELQKREAKLFKQHGHEWLGDLAPFLLDQQKAKEPSWGDPFYQFQFRRGWLDSLELRNYGVVFTRVLARAPQIRLLQRLVLNAPDFEEADEYEPGPDVPEGSYFPALPALLHCPYLGNVRMFQFGEEEDDNEQYFNCLMRGGETLITFVRLMPRLEELRIFCQNIDTDQLFSLKTLNCLRILQVYHMDHYPMQQLAKNPSLGNLTHLLIHPHCMREDEPYLRLPQVRAVVRSTTLKSLTHLRLRLCDMGDAGSEEIVASGILKRLKVLDLRNGRITDAGARTLAECPDLRNLELLNLNRNCLTADGIAALKATGVKFTADGQWQPTGDYYHDQEYLYEGDTE
jgi:uncharacterized protein (TIGR02996 family)